MGLHAYAFPHFQEGVEVFLCPFLLRGMIEMQAVFAIHQSTRGCRRTGPVGL